MVTLEEVRLFLRIDNDEEDRLLSSLIVTAKELVEGVIRQNLESFGELPETLRQAMLFVISTMYEQRQVTKNGIDTQSMMDLVKRLTFAYRKEVF